MSSDAAVLRELARGVYAFIGAGGDSNAGAIETPDGILVFDAQQHVRLARKFRSALDRSIGKPIEFMIYTHYHLDHTGGSSVFSGEAPILAHDKTRQFLTEILGEKYDPREEISDFETKVRLLFGPNIYDFIPAGDPGWDWFKGRLAAPDYDSLSFGMPTHTFTDSYTFHLPDRSVVLEYLGPAHCDGDLIVHLPDDKIVFVADLLFVGRFPWLGDGDIGGWIGALDHVLALDVEQVVPGHGVPVTKNELKNFRDMLQALRGGVEKALEAGQSEDEAVRSVRLPAYESLPRYPEWMPWNVRNIYRSFSSS